MCAWWRDCCCSSAALQLRLSNACMHGDAGNHQAAHALAFTHSPFFTPNDRYYFTWLCYNWSTIHTHHTFLCTYLFYGFIVLTALSHTCTVAEKEGIAGYEMALNYNGVPFALLPRAASEIKDRKSVV